MDDDANKLLKELFDGLPKPIQNAITSADVQKRLRELADKHKLHLDQWETLETEVRLGLFGLKPLVDLAKNIQAEVGVSQEVAEELAGDISETVLAPIREELERELEHPEAKVKEVSEVETVRAQTLKEATPASAGTASSLPTSPPSAPSIIPATPPPAPPVEKVARMPASGAYRPGEVSIARKDIHDDPYREPPT